VDILHPKLVTILLVLQECEAIDLSTRNQK